MRRRAIEAATRAWISRFVVHERLCPFAAASRILITVDTFGGADDDLAQRIQERWRLDPLSDSGHAALALAAVDRGVNQVSKLLSAETATCASSNLFIVWPVGLSDMDMYTMFVSALAQRSGLDLAGVTGEGADSPAVVFPFHPSMLTSHAGETPDYKFASPFPMAHVIPQSELSRARQQLRARKAAGKACLLGRNAHVMREATAERRREWDELLERARVSAVDPTVGVV